MNKTTLLILAGLICLGGAVVLISRTGANPDASHSHTPSREPAASEQSTIAPAAARVPAHYTQAPALLPPTLPPERFSGKAQEAYIVARAIPQTLAQLPCYCYCDRGMGHKSLHSCFEDEHASHCAVCVDEALMAYRLQREEKLSPEQVRQRIIEMYSH